MRHTITENKIVVKIVSSRKCPWSGRRKRATQDVLLARVFNQKEGNKGSGEERNDEGKKEGEKEEKRAKGKKNT